MPRLVSSGGLNRIIHVISTREKKRFCILRVGGGGGEMPVSIALKDMWPEKNENCTLIRHNI